MKKITVLVTMMIIAVVSVFAEPYSYAERRRVDVQILEQIIPNAKEAFPGEHKEGLAFIEKYAGYRPIPANNKNRDFKKLSNEEQVFVLTVVSLLEAVRNK